MIPFKAISIHSTGPGTWLVRYFDQPDQVINFPVAVSRHRFHWTARLAAWAYMRGWSK